MNNGPLARRDGLVVKTVGDEVLVYDLERARAHSLDALAAAIWRQCDGRRPVAALAAAVRAETGVPVTAAAVEYGLAALGRARLLAGERPVPGPTRRQVLARIGTAAAIPLVLSITAPTAAQAQSSQPCIPGPRPFMACGSPGQASCCPGLVCCNGFCFVAEGGSCGTPFALCCPALNQICLEPPFPPTGVNPCTTPPFTNCICVTLGG